MYTRNTFLPNGQPFVKIDELDLARPTMPLMRYAITVRHFVDDARQAAGARRAAGRTMARQ